jgi:hypothetical protein
MGCTIQIDRDHRVSYMRMTEVVSYAAIAACQDTLRGAPGFDPSAPLLLDLRDATVRLTQEDMLALAGRTPLQPWTRLAILVTASEKFELAQTYEFIRELEVDAPTARAFVDIEGALAWLGVSGWRPA